MNKLIYKPLLYTIIAACFILLLFAIDYCTNFGYLTELILALSALVIFWYTYETHRIRIIDEEKLTKTKMPTVGFNLYLNEKNRKDIRFIITNHSQYPISCLVKMKIKVLNRTNKKVIRGDLPPKSCTNV